jgi:hypothetical protein
MSLFRESIWSCFAVASSYKWAISAGRLATNRTWSDQDQKVCGGAMKQQSTVQVHTIVDELLQDTSSVLGDGHLLSDTCRISLALLFDENQGGLGWIRDK